MLPRQFGAAGSLDLCEGVDVRDLVAWLLRRNDDEAVTQELLLLDDGLVISYDVDEQGTRVGKHERVSRSDVPLVFERMRCLAVSRLDRFAMRLGNQQHVRTAALLPLCMFNILS